MDAGLKRIVEWINGEVCLGYLHPRGEVRGTAFAVIGRTEEGMRYALTAYHVVSELMANLLQIYLEDEDGKAEMY